MHLPSPETASRGSRGNREAETKSRMLSSSDRKPACSWDSNSDEYLAHLIKMERALSIAPGVPHYPDVHKAFNNKSPYDEKQGNSSKQRQPARKVSFQDQQGSSDNSQEETDEDEGDQTIGSIQQKYRGFQLSKWKTFKGY